MTWPCLFLCMWIEVAVSRCEACGRPFPKAGKFCDDRCYAVRLEVVYYEGRIGRHMEEQTA